MEYIPVLDVYRSDYLDNRFFALVFLYNKNGLIWKLGDDNGDKFFLRSLFKPIQASILNNTEIFNDRELAIMQGSHCGTPTHTNLVLSILNKSGLSQTDLKCPAIMPLDNSYRLNKYTPLHNNCSGKHAMMITYCVQNEFDISNYTDFNHPVQKQILKKLLYYAQTNEYIQTIDGCGAPVYGLKMSAIANAFLNYYADSANLKFIEAYKNNPYIIGGNNRTDSKITALNENIISKVGAGGFIYVYNFKTQEILITKMSQDNNLAREIITLDILHKLGWCAKKEYDENIYTQNNFPVGKYRINFDLS